MVTGKKHFQRLAQYPATDGVQQVEGALVGRADTAIGVERQQPFAEQPHRLGLQMEAQQPLLLEVAQEVTALDHFCRKVDQRHGMKLALTRDIRPRR
ncbi:hypothetical protein D3C73_1449400 [compost metagenome]